MKTNTIFKIYLGNQIVEVLLEGVRSRNDLEETAKNLRDAIAKKKQESLKAGEPLLYDEILEEVKKIPDLISFQITDKNGWLEKGIKAEFVI